MKQQPLTLKFATPEKAKEDESKEADNQPAAPEPKAEKAKEEIAQKATEIKENKIKQTEVAKEEIKDMANKITTEAKKIIESNGSKNQTNVAMAVTNATKEEPAKNLTAAGPAGAKENATEPQAAV